MERRCAGTVVATGLAGGEIGEDLLDDFGSFDARDDAQRAATHATVFDIDAEDSLEPLHPAHGRTTRPMGLAGGMVGGVGDDAAAMFEVRGEHAVVPGEVGAGAWNEGGEAGDEVLEPVRYEARPNSSSAVIASLAPRRVERIKSAISDSASSSPWTSRYSAMRSSWFSGWRRTRTGGRREAC